MFSKNKKIVSKMSFSCEIYNVFCEKENKQYILQDDGGGHLGFMLEQYLKIKNNVTNDFLIQNSH